MFREIERQRVALASLAEAREKRGPTARLAPDDGDPLAEGPAVPGGVVERIAANRPAGLSHC